jgi:glycosyltransferase involved in cell wall biosynthesis
MTRDCVIITWFASDQPGFLDFSYRIAALAKTYRVTVISAKPLTQAELLIKGVEYVVLAHQESRVGWALYLLACARWIRKRKPARAVLLHSMLAPLIWLIRHTPAALYWNEHPSRFTASPPNHPLIKRLARKLSLRWAFFEAARRATLVMPIGEAHYEDLLKNGCRPAQTRLIYMGADRAFVNASEQIPERSPDAPLQLVYVGTVSQARGRDVMLEALAQANRDEVVAHLTIIGASQDELQYCADYAKRLGITDAVHLHGRLPGAAIPDTLKDKDAGLCLWEDKPWWRFNPPTKLFEYLAAGLPVLASDICTHTHYIADWRNGLIFQYDSEALAVAIRSLWTRRHELPTLKQQAREAGKHYLWDAIEPQFLAVIEGMHEVAQWREQSGGKTVPVLPRN